MCVGVRMALPLPLPPLPPIPVASAAGAGSGSGAVGEVQTWGGTGFVMPFDVKWPNSVSVRDLLKGSASVLGRTDFTAPLQIFERQWVESVGDLRFLIQEGMLRSIGLPIRLCVWLEDELGKLAVPTGAVSSGGAATASVGGIQRVPSMSVSSAVPIGGRNISAPSVYVTPPVDYKQLSAPSAMANGKGSPAPFDDEKGGGAMGSLQFVHSSDFGM